MSPSEAIFVGLVEAAGNIKLNGWLLGFALFLKYGLAYVLVAPFIIFVPSLLIGEYFGNAKTGEFVGLILFIGIPSACFLWKLWLHLKEKRTKREIKRPINENEWHFGFVLFLKYGLIYVVVSTLLIIMPAIGEYFGNAKTGEFVGLILFIGIPSACFLWKLWLHLKEKRAEREIERQVNEWNRENQIYTRRDGTPVSGYYCRPPSR